MNIINSLPPRRPKSYGAGAEIKPKEALEQMNAAIMVLNMLRAVGASQAMAWPLFDRFLGKDRHNFLVRMRSSFSHQILTIL